MDALFGTVGAIALIPTAFAYRCMMLMWSVSISLRTCAASINSATLPNDATGTEQGRTPVSLSNCVSTVLLESFRQLAPLPALHRRHILGTLTGTRLQCQQSIPQSRYSTPPCPSLPAAASASRARPRLNAVSYSAPTPELTIDSAAIAVIRGGESLLGAPVRSSIIRS